MVSTFVGACAQHQIQVCSWSLIICMLCMLLMQYGDILNLLVSRKKNGSAVVEFSQQQAAVSDLSALRHLEVKCKSFETIFCA